MENVSIIVSRFNEDLKWTLEAPFHKFKYIVYNKGSNNDFEKRHVIEIINLKNVGKNDHTYLYHIIVNYYRLTNIVVFFPGSLNMDSKKPKAIEILHNIIKSNYKRAYFIGHWQESIKESFNDFQLYDWKTSDSQNCIENNESELQLARIRPYGLWYECFFGNIRAQWSTWWGIFSIDKRDIIRHPVTRYQSLIQTINKHSNPEAGHYIERSWGAIFYPLFYTQKK